MKNLLVLVPVLLLSLSCSKEKTSARIAFKTDQSDVIKIYHPIDDVIIWNSRIDTVVANDQNTFTFEKDISRPEYVKVLADKKVFHFIMFPESNTAVEYIDSDYVFSGDNVEGQKLLNKFKRPSYSLGEATRYAQDSTASQVSAKINLQKQKELDQIDALLVKKLIDKEFAKVLRLETDYFYASRILEIISTKTNNDDLMALVDQTIKSYPVDIDYKPNKWFNYTQGVIYDIPVYKQESEGVIASDSVGKLYENDQFHTFKYRLINQYETKEVAERVIASNLITAASYNNFESSLITLHDQFDKDFPGSAYTPYIDEKVEKIRDYYRKIDQKMPESIKIIDNDNIKSLEELIEQVKGEKYYVDLWATWCSPCKREFKHNPELNAFLKTKGYKKLYISIDKEKDEDKWIKDIKYFELDGIHFLASREFVIDFEKNHSPHKDIIMIPQYMIVNENGEILNKSAPNPSELPELKKIMAKL